MLTVLRLCSAVLRFRVQCVKVPCSLCSDCVRTVLSCVKGVLRSCVQCVKAVLRYCVKGISRDITARLRTIDGMVSQ